LQSKKTTEVRIDLRVLMSPLFYGISELSPVCMAKLESKVSLRNKIVTILCLVTSTVLAKAAAHPA
jgi:hypothetical protein